MKKETNKVSFFYGIIVLMALLAFIGTYYQKNRALTVDERTEQRALLVGKKLIDSQFEQKFFLPEAKPAERGLASTESLEVIKKNLEGEVGRDAWGQPFYFKVKGDGVKNSTLYIWSLGANGKPEFKDLKSLMAEGPRGDDILVTIPF